MKASSGSEFSNPEQLFNEVATIAAIEHSLIVEYLLLHYVLRHDRPPTDSHPLAISSSEAAEFAFGLATREMRHFHGLNQALVSFGRPTQMGRSATIDSGFAATFAPTLATSVIERIASRERELAVAVDDRYSGLQKALRSPAMGATDGPDLGRLVFLDLNPDHRGALMEFDIALRSVPGDVPIGTPPGDPDAVELGLLDISDQWYGLLLAVVDAWFGHEAELGGVLPGRAQSVMDALNRVNGRIVEQARQLPRFTLPDG